MIVTIDRPYLLPFFLCVGLLFRSSPTQARNVSSSAALHEAALQLKLAANRPGAFEWSELGASSSHVMVGAGLASLIMALYKALHGEQVTVLEALPERAQGDQRSYDSRQQLLLLSSLAKKILDKLGVNTADILEPIQLVEDVLFNPERRGQTLLPQIKNPLMRPASEQGMSLNQVVAKMMADKNGSAMQRADYLTRALLGTPAYVVPIGALQRAMIKRLRELGQIVAFGCSVDLDSTMQHIDITEPSGSKHRLSGGINVFWGIGGGRRGREVSIRRFGEQDPPRREDGSIPQVTTAVLIYRTTKADTVTRVTRHPRRWAHIVSPKSRRASVIVSLPPEIAACSEPERTRRALSFARRVSGREPNTLQSIDFVLEEPHILKEVSSLRGRHIALGDAVGRWPILSGRGAGDTAIQATYWLAEQLGQAKRESVDGQESTHHDEVLKAYRRLGKTIGLAGAQLIGHAADYQNALSASSSSETLDLPIHPIDELHGLTPARLHFDDAADLLTSITKAFHRDQGFLAKFLSSIDEKTPIRLHANDSQQSREVTSRQMPIDRLLEDVYRNLETLRKGPIVATRKQAPKAYEGRTAQRLLEWVKRKLKALPHELRTSSAQMTSRVPIYGAAGLITLAGVQLFDMATDTLFPPLWAVHQTHLLALPLLLGGLDFGQLAGTLLGPDDRMLAQVTKEDGKSSGSQWLRRLSDFWKYQKAARSYRRNRKQRSLVLNGKKTFARRRPFWRRLLGAPAIEGVDRDHEITHWLGESSADGWVQAYESRHTMVDNGQVGDNSTVPITKSACRTCFANNPPLSEIVSLTNGLRLVEQVARELVNAADEESFVTRSISDDHERLSFWQKIGRLDEWTRQLWNLWKTQTQVGNISRVSRKAEKMLIQVATRQHLHHPRNIERIRTVIDDAMRAYQGLIPVLSELHSANHELAYSQTARQRSDIRARRHTILKKLGKDVNELVHKHIKGGQGFSPIRWIRQNFAKARAAMTHRVVPAGGF